MFPLHLDDDVVLRKEGRFALDVVNLLKKVPASVLIRPYLKRGKLEPDDLNIIELEPDDHQIIEVTRSGIHVVHWVIARSGFFEEVRRKHIPNDRIVLEYIEPIDQDMELARLSKAKHFRID